MPHATEALLNEEEKSNICIRNKTFKIHIGKTFPCFAFFRTMSG